MSAVSAEEVAQSHRLDPHYHLSAGVRAAQLVRRLRESGVPTRLLAGPDGLGRVEPARRTKRLRAGRDERRVPYLRPYDVFDYLPQPADWLPLAEAPEAESQLVTRGAILQTCSGRNLGPLALVDAYLAEFAISDDMLRLYIDDADSRLFAYAFLNTPTGQALIRRNKTGGVIDHLSAADFASVEVPLAPAQFEPARQAIGEAFDLRERARVALSRLVREYEEALPPPTRPSPLSGGWTVQRSAVGTRLDAAFHDPVVEQCRRDLAGNGGVALSAVSSVFVPDRYRRYYVESDYGKPILSGRQLLQWRPVNLRFIAERSFDSLEYELRSGWLAFGAEGRAEERLGFPTFVADDRDGWLASEHVMRIAPGAGVSAGALWLSFATVHVQTQVKALACGSVIDEVNPWDLQNVVLPPLDPERGEEVVAAWGDFARADAIEEGAISALEDALQTLSGQSAIA